MDYRFHRDDEERDFLEVANKEAKPCHHNLEMKIGLLEQHYSVPSSTDATWVLWILCTF
jgi:hypothetical protein